MKKKDAIKVKHNKLALLESRVANQQKRIRDLETQLELQARMFNLYLIQIIDNDLKAVDAAIRDYWGLAEAPKED